MTKKPLQGTARALIQLGMALAGLGMMAIPPLVVALSGTASQDALWTALRIAALEAATLISAGVVIGAFRPLLARAITPKPLHRFHVTAGVTGFLLAVAHGTMVAIFGLAGYGPDTLVIMPLAALAVLTLQIASGLARRRLRRSWRYFHRLSYGVIALVVVHAFRLGYELSTGITMKVCLSVYAAAVAAGLFYRAGLALRRAGTRKPSTA